MVQLTRITFNDDNYSSTDIDVMVCSSIPYAKEFILEGINKSFEGKWKSLEEAAKELGNDLSFCHWDENEKSFIWLDNGKGEKYIIANINIREVNTKYQHIGMI